VSELFQKILCPVEFDDQCRAALDMAQSVAEQNHARVWVLHVVSPEADSDMSSEKGATLRLRKIVDERLHGKVDYEFIVRTGSAADAALNAAREFESDLIVIPTHGRAGLKRLVLGSVAELVIRESTVPVLAVRHPDP
jgi:nucleotide-binding universal stress UspA family protein